MKYETSAPVFYCANCGAQNPNPATWVNGYWYCVGCAPSGGQVVTPGVDQVALINGLLQAKAELEVAINRYCSECENHDFCWDNKYCPLYTYRWDK